VFSKDDGDHDSHGMAVTGNGRFVWAADRFSNQIEVIEAQTETLVNTFALPRGSEDPAVDLMVLSPRGGYVLATLRGACPLTANTASNNAVGNMPGLAVIAVNDVGLRGRLVGVAPILNRAPAGFDCPTRGDDTPGSITNQADPHGIALRLK
jgi:DNA-binding beta-propeller fold protein YncE